MLSLFCERVFDSSCSLVPQVSQTYHVQHKYGTPNKVSLVHNTKARIPVSQQNYAFSSAVIPYTWVLINSLLLVLCQCNWNTIKSIDIRLLVQRWIASSHIVWKTTYMSIRFWRCQRRTKGNIDRKDSRDVWKDANINSHDQILKHTL